MCTRRTPNKSPAGDLPLYEKSPLPERRPKPQAKSFPPTHTGAGMVIISCPLRQIKEEIEAMISHVTATAGKGSCTEALALAEDYLDTIGRENYNHCLYRIAEEYCSENTTESIEKGLDLFKRIPEDHPDYEHAKQRIADYQVLSRSSFNGQWYGEEFVSAVGHSYNISVWIRLRYANGFKLECTTKILDNSGFVWTENTVSFFADSVTDTKLGGRELQRHFELPENGRLWEYDNGAIYSLTRAE